MLILEAKVRKGVKPLVTIDEHASVSEIADAAQDLLLTIFESLNKLDQDKGLLFLLTLGQKLQEYE